MAAPAGAAQQGVEAHEEHWVVDWQGKRNVAHMAWTVDVILSTRPAHVVLAARPQGQVVQASRVGVEEAVQGDGVGDSLAAHLLDVFSSVRLEAHRGEAAGRSEARVYSPHVCHCCLLLHLRVKTKMSVVLSCSKTHVGQASDAVTL